LEVERAPLQALCVERPLPVACVHPSAGAGDWAEGGARSRPYARGQGRAGVVRRRAAAGLRWAEWRSSAAAAGARGRRHWRA
jgi:hypothetical protein